MGTFPETFDDDLRWMDPLARDMISICYAQIKRPPDVLASVSTCHGLLWRGALTGRNDVEVLRRELSRLAALAGMSESALEWVNRQVIAELMETIARRYSRSPREASRHSFEVARAACCIAQARPFQENRAVQAPVRTGTKIGAAV